VSHICTLKQTGAILIFMPGTERGGGVPAGVHSSPLPFWGYWRHMPMCYLGLYEIKRTMRQLSSSAVGGRLCILPLHGSLQPEEQNRIFGPVTAGRRLLPIPPFLLPPSTSWLLLCACVRARARVCVCVL
jgi:hypothetical protein